MKSLAMMVLEEQKARVTCRKFFSMTSIESWFLSIVTLHAARMATLDQQWWPLSTPRANTARLVSKALAVMGYFTHVLWYGFPHQAGTVDEKLYAQTFRATMNPTNTMSNTLGNLILLNLFRFAVLCQPSHGRAARTTDSKTWSAFWKVCTLPATLYKLYSCIF